MDILPFDRNYFSDDIVELYRIIKYKLEIVHTFNRFNPDPNKGAFHKLLLEILHFEKQFEEHFNQKH